MLPVTSPKSLFGDRKDSYPSPKFYLKSHQHGYETTAWQWQSKATLTQASNFLFAAGFVSILKKRWHFKSFFPLLHKIIDAYMHVAMKYDKLWFIYNTSNLNNGVLKEWQWEQSTRHTPRSPRWAELPSLLHSELQTRFRWALQAFEAPYVKKRSLGPGHS